MFTNTNVAQNLEGQLQKLPKYWLFGLCAVHLFIWTLVPALFQKNGSLDVLEAIAWGSQWQLGYDRDPFLVAWLAQIASWFGGHSLWSIYALSQLCIVATFVTVWRLARQIGLNPIHAFMSVVFLEGIFYYHFTTAEFNDNVLQIPLWTFVAYFYYRALTQQKTTDWLLTGGCAALALLAKYFTVMLGLPMVALLLITPQGRQSFKKPGIYLAAVFAFMLFLPNLYWQYKHDWLYIHYALNRAHVAPSWFNHIHYPFKFALSQLLALSPAFVLFYWSVKPKFSNQHSQNFERTFLYFMALGPILTTLFYSALTGTQIRSMWGTPLFSLTGLTLIYFSRPKTRYLERFIGAYGSYFVLALFSYIIMVTASPYLLGYAKNEFYPSQAIAKDVTELWHKHFQSPVPYVLGSRFMTSQVNVYSADHPTPYFDLNIDVNPWINEQKVSEQGAVVLWNAGELGKNVPEKIKTRFGHVGKPIIKTFSWQTKAKRIEPLLIGIAILPPKA